MQTIRQALFGENYNPYEGFQSTSVDMQGWGSTSPTFEEVICKYRPKKIIEVGSWKGCSAIHMANICKSIYNNNDFEIVCIDTFLGSVEHWDKTAITMSHNNGRPNIYETFLSNVINANHTDVITPFPVDSHNGWQTLLNFKVKADMIYIDAGHDYDAVSRDILGYMKVLSNTGFILGDDIHHGPIIQACDDLLPGWERKLDKFLWVR